MDNMQEVGKKFGLEKGLIDNLVASQPTRKEFLRVIADSKIQEGSKKIGNLLYSVATKVPVIIEGYKKLLAELIGQGKIDNSTQLDFAITHLKDQRKKGGIDEALFRKDCGIDYKASAQEIKKIIALQIENVLDASKKFAVLGKIKTLLPYIDSKILKDQFEQIWATKKFEQKPVQKKVVAPPAQEEVENKPLNMKSLSQLIGREMNLAVNSKNALQWRKKKFGDMPLTRFPPEPNGYLHIGHCKAMRFNFMQAKVSGGECYLRFDDTNPLKENVEFIENIKQNIAWLGYKPWKITHASDNFQLIYESAVKLIKQGNAFVCSETKEESHAKRQKGLPSKDRNRSIEQNLRLFQEMKMGLYEQGQLCLRAKIDYQSPNTTLRDPAIYRIRYTSHPHCGNKWCIYPLYDFTHPICDSIQGITYSLCSLQFQVRRQLYYWFLDKLDMFKPNVWEYSRLNITYTVMSKRLLHRLIFDNKVSGWNDPRVPTINGMRRRGYPAQAINNFCDVIGVTRRGNQNYIDFGVLENQIRKYLDVSAPRTMAILDPVLLTIVDLGAPTQIQVKLFPKDQKKGHRIIKFTSKIYVERSDIRLIEDSDFFGICPGRVVGLKYAQNIKIKQIKVEQGQIVEVIAQLDKQNTKPKSYLSWISTDQCFSCESRIYSTLFNTPKAGEELNYLDFLNNTHQIYKNTQIHTSFHNNLKLYDRVQFQRKGFFCTDSDSDFINNKIVWNMTVGLTDRLKKI